MCVPYNPKEIRISLKGVEGLDISNNSCRVGNSRTSLKGVEGFSTILNIDGIHVFGLTRISLKGVEGTGAVFCV